MASGRAEGSSDSAATSRALATAATVLIASQGIASPDMLRSVLRSAAHRFPARGSTDIAHVLPPLLTAPLAALLPGSVLHRQVTAWLAPDDSEWLLAGACGVRDPMVVADRACRHMLWLHAAQTRTPASSSMYGTSP